MRRWFVVTTVGVLLALGSDCGDSGEESGAIASACDTVLETFDVAG
jgi:hypothetical protein